MRSQYQARQRRRRKVSAKKENGGGSREYTGGESGSSGFSCILDQLSGSGGSFEQTDAGGNGLYVPAGKSLALGEKERDRDTTQERCFLIQ